MNKIYLAKYLSSVLTSMTNVYSNANHSMKLSCHSLCFCSFATILIFPYEQLQIHLTFPNDEGKMRKVVFLYIEENVLSLVYNLYENISTELTNARQFDDENCYMN